MGTYDTRGGSPLHDPAFDHEAPVGPLEEEVLTELEAMDQHHAAWTATRNELARLFARVVSAWVRDGVIITRQAAKKPARCLMWVSVAGGNHRGAVDFRVVGRPSVEVHPSGDPALSYWVCSTVPISPKTGKDMSGRPGNSVRKDGTVTMRGRVFVDRDDATQQQSRDEFMQMVADAERILLACPECGATMTHDDGCASTRDEPGQAPALHCLTCGIQVPDPVVT